MGRNEREGAGRPGREQEAGVERGAVCPRAREGVGRWGGPGAVPVGFGGREQVRGERAKGRGS